MLGTCSRQLVRDVRVAVKSDVPGQAEHGPAVGRARGSQAVF